MFYVRTADRLQRTASWLESLEGGLPYLRAVILDDTLGICADLDAAMDAHVAAYEDEWAGVLASAERLRRSAATASTPDAAGWAPVCRFEELQPERGVAARVGRGPGGGVPYL